MSARAPLVTVVMPTYNSAPWVEQAVTSLLVQTHREVHVVVVDDASADATPDIVTRIRDSRVRFVPSDVNRGCGANLNRGLALVPDGCELIARLDGDDYALPHRLERQVAFLAAHPEVDVVDAQAHVVDARGRWLPPPAIYRGREIAWIMHRVCPILHPAVLMRRAALPPGGYPAPDTWMEDYALWLSMLPHARFERVQEPLIVYRRHDTTIGAMRSAAPGRLDGPSWWASVIGPRVGLTLTAEDARAWLGAGRFREGADPTRLAALARRLDPLTLDVGAKAPPWTPRSLARCRRIHARHVLKLLRRGRRDPAWVRALAPVAVRAVAGGIVALARRAVSPG